MKIVTQWQCKSKIGYKTRHSAWESSLYYFKTLGTYGTPYKCRHCKKFHLTAKYATPIPSKQFISGFNKWFGIEVL